MTMEQFKDFIVDWQKWVSFREGELKQPYGWLSLVGLFWLPLGKSSIGSGVINNIILPNSPNIIGEIELKENGSVYFYSNRKNSSALVNEKYISYTRLYSDSDPNPSLIKIGRLHIQLIKRGDEFALRIRDPSCEKLQNFCGIKYFPPDIAWKIQAKWEEYAQPLITEQTTIDGRTHRVPILGVACLELAGTRYYLQPFEHTEEHVIFSFGDLTNGVLTYPGGRFLMASSPKDGKIILDFNRAFNPPCAFTDFATCPIPPPENKIALKINAGEFAYPALA